MDTIFRNLTYGDLDKDIRILESHCDDSEKMFNAFGDNCFDIHDVKRIRNLISAVKKYRNMYHKEYRHHMDHKEYAARAENRAGHYQVENTKLTDEIDDLKKQLNDKKKR